MLNLKQFTFNPFQVNTFVLYDDSGAAIIIDPACYNQQEFGQLIGFLDERALSVKYIVNTHGHVDHLAGICRAKERYDVPFIMHSADNELVKDAVNHGLIFGLDVDPPPMPDQYLDENENLSFGNTTLEIFHIPGHSPGSLVYFNRKEKFVIAGDVIFKGSIGRTDLPGGNYDILIGGIKEKLLSLPDGYIVYPGHGPSTTIGEEKSGNPFLR